MKYIQRIGLTVFIIGMVGILVGWITNDNLHKTLSLIPTMIGICMFIGLPDNALKSTTTSKTKEVIGGKIKSD